MRPPEASPTSRVLVVDRVACTGHGVCAQLLPGQVRLDEWGYPILRDGRVDDGAATRAAVKLCPARALFTREDPQLLRLHSGDLAERQVRRKVSD